MDATAITLRLPLATSLRVLRALGTATGALEAILITRLGESVGQRENLAELVQELRDAGDELVGLKRLESAP